MITHDRLMACAHTSGVGRTQRNDIRQQVGSARTTEHWMIKIRDLRQYKDITSSNTAVQVSPSSSLL